MLSTNPCKSLDKALVLERTLSEQMALQPEDLSQSFDQLLESTELSKEHIIY